MPVLFFGATHKTEFVFESTVLKKHLSGKPSLGSFPLCDFLIQEYHAQFSEPHYVEVVEGLPRQEDGYVDLPKGPGLGLTIDEDLMNSHPYLPLGMSERGI